jgi:hypothetical protein
MGKFVWVLTFLTFHQIGFSQKLIEKELVNPETKFIEINTANCFLVTMATHRGKQLKIEASMEGEYARDLSIALEEKGSNILIGANFLPSFTPPNDKLSAHKVISISLSVTLPEYMKVKVYGTRSNVFAKGSYTDLSVILADGNCTLNKIAEKVTVKTQKGEIVVHGARGTVDTKSEYGRVIKGDISKGEAYFNLYSVEGDILVNKNYP